MMKLIPHSLSPKQAFRWILLLLVSQILLTAEGQAQHSTEERYRSRSSEEMESRLQNTLLADALLNLAESRNLELAYAPELLNGKTSTCPILPPGDEAAIKCILADSGLRVRRLNSGVFVIRKPSAKEQNLMGTLTGTVKSYETGAVLAGAHITIDGVALSTASGSTGAFNIDNIPPGLYNLQVSMVGYQPTLFQQVDVIAGQTLNVELNLEEATFPMSEVIVTSNKRGRRLIFPDSMSALDYQGIRVGSVSAGLFLSSQPSKVNGVQLGGLGSMARDSLRGVQFGGVFNSAGNASRGVQFGGVFNTVAGDFKGYQFGGVLNQLAGTLDGGQFAGTVNTSLDMRGVQFGGVANLADGYARGLQAAGVVNVTGGMRGAQFAGLANRSNVMSGVQAAGVMNMSGPMQGVQASGIVNIVDGGYRGLQMAGLVNMAGDMEKGVQLSGMVNVAGEIDRGLQLGVINLAKRNDGLPIGAISYVKETGLRYDAWVDETGMISTAIRSGNRWFSNYLGVSARPDKSLDNKAFVFGLGGEFSLKPRLYSTLDMLYYGLGWSSSEPDEDIVKLRLALGFKLTPHLAVFGGPSLNMLYSNNPDTDIAIPGRLSEGEIWQGYYDIWSGFAFGLRISGKP